MYIAYVLLCAALAAAAPNPRPQDASTDTEPSDDPSDDPSDTLLPTITTLNTTIPLPTLPSGNFTLPLPSNITTITGPTSPITSSATLPTDLTSYTSKSKTRKPHTEPIPVFTSSCRCPGLATVAYPCYAYDALNRCNFEENHSLVCFYINGGCPSPTRTCSNLFKATPPTGKHPCDLSPETSAAPTITALPTITASPTLA